MRGIVNLALASLVTAAMFCSPADVGAQVRRSTNNNTTQNRSTASQQRRSTSSSSSSSVRQSGTSSSGQQVRRSTSSSSAVRQGSSSTRQNSSSSSSVRQSGTSSSGQQVRRSTSSSSAVRQGSSSVSTGSSSHRVAQPIGSTSSQVRQSVSSSTGNGSTVRRNTNVTKNGLGTVTSQMRSQSGNYSQVGRENPRYNRSDDFRINDHNVQRIPPRDRDFLSHDRPGHFYSPDHHHCFGFRVEALPPRFERRSYFGIDYYICNDVYYRPYHGHYIVCRPPFGVTIRATVANIAFASVNFAYYSNVYRTYGAIDANNRYIDQQNRIIAQNNATIMAQNRSIAMNPDAAYSSYDIASRLGLVQSYAYADKNYYYEDGVFYAVNDYGEYQVIVPPAGALVQKLPEDYDIITLGGNQYYRVDDTVYRLTLVEGNPYLEVLGQMYGSLARTYNMY